MPRTARASKGGYYYHVINRGNARSKVFRKTEDYQEFADLLEQDFERLPVPVLAYCLMPDHFHLVLSPTHNGDLSRFMQWLLTAHVRRYHSKHQSSGHVWQGRFKAFPIQDDEHLASVLHYVEGNPLRARLVKKAQDWEWSSLRCWFEHKRPEFLQSKPVSRGAIWVRRVNRPIPVQELAQLRQSVNRGSPYGTEAWARKTARTLGLESSMRPRGRPRKSENTPKR